MADVHSAYTRSYNMSCIHGKDTKPEELVRKYLFSKGFRYRKNDARLPGKPDIVLPKYRAVVFFKRMFLARTCGMSLFCMAKEQFRVLEEKNRRQCCSRRKNL